ncbi:hypothetical protein [Streptomyces sp. NPDC051909]|uniref:hypothetical protein n=1 Tax=Streptomyces sp. NPDC051909 TaxID=3154944 RepID=UPI0034144A7B
MHLTRLTRCIRRIAAPAAALAAAVCLCATATARADTVVLDTIDETTTHTGEAPLEGCLPAGLVGRYTVVEHTVAQVVRTDGAMVVKGVDSYDFHMDLPDGRYVQSGTDYERFTVVLARPYHTVLSTVSEDERTIYAADGTPVGTLTITERKKVVFEDADLDGEADPGEITVERVRFDLTCG